MKKVETKHMMGNINHSMARHHDVSFIVKHKSFQNKLLIKASSKNLYQLLRLLRASTD
jgi:hypothetical protein